jgi:hypothetical protein
VHGGDDLGGSVRLRDNISRQVVNPPSTGTGCSPKQRERFVHGDAKTLGKHALRLLDDDSRIQGPFELRPILERCFGHTQQTAQGHTGVLLNDHCGARCPITHQGDCTFGLNRCKGDGGGGGATRQSLSCPPPAGLHLSARPARESSLECGILGPKGGPRLPLAGRLLVYIGRRSSSQSRQPGPPSP